MGIHEMLGEIFDELGDHENAELVRSESYEGETQQFVDTIKTEVRELKLSRQAEV